MTRATVLQHAQRIMARVAQALRIGGQRAWVNFGAVSAQTRLHDPEDALKIAAAWRCVTLLSQTIAMLPWHVFKRTEAGEGFRANGHPVDWLLHSEASSEQTAYAWKRTLVMHMLLWGNGYAEIERDGANRPYALWLLEPDRVTPGRNASGRVVYSVRNQGGASVELPAANVFHLAGLGFDGLRGYSVLELAAQSLGASLSLDSQVATYFARGFRPMGFLRTKGKLNPDGLATLEERLDEYAQNRRWRAMPLDQDMEYQALSTSPEDAQLIDMRRFSVLDVCRWFGVPPHLAFDLERATFSNIESQGREFLTYGLMPHIVQMEQEANRKLLTSQFGGLYSKMNVNALVRGDMAQRAAFYQAMRNMGAFTVNDILRFEEMNTIGEEGDVRVMQSQYVPTDALGAPPAAPAPTTTPAPASTLRALNGAGAAH